MIYRGELTADRHLPRCQQRFLNDYGENDTTCDLVPLPVLPARDANRTRTLRLKNSTHKSEEWLGNQKARFDTRTHITAHDNTCMLRFSVSIHYGAKVTHKNTQMAVHVVL